MLQVHNRLIVALFLIVYILLVRSWIFPAIGGIKSSQELDQQFNQLSQHQLARITAMNRFKELEQKWGSKIDLSQRVLLPFLLNTLKKSSIELVDFKEETLTKKDSQEMTKRYLIQLKGPTEPTLILLNALEQEFHFATIQNLVLSRKKIRRKNVLITQFYFEQ